PVAPRPARRRTRQGIDVLTGWAESSRPTPQHAPRVQTGTGARESRSQEGGDKVPWLCEPCGGPHSRLTEPWHLDRPLALLHPHCHGSIERLAVQRGHSGGPPRRNPPHNQGSTPMRRPALLTVLLLALIVSSGPGAAPPSKGRQPKSESPRLTRLKTLTFDRR